MATTTSVTTTFAGERDEELKYVSSALYGGETLSAGLFNIKERIKKTRVLKTLSVTGTIIKARTTLFTPTGTVTVGERELTPKYLEVNIQLTKSDFEDDWDSPQMGDSAFKTLPNDLSQAFVLELVNIVAQSLENQLWNGTDGVNELHGIMTRAKADAAIPADQKITNATSTTSNIITELAKVVSGIPAGVRSKRDVVICISNNMKYNYIDALGGFGASGLGANGVAGQGTMWYNEGNSLSFRGVELQGVFGLNDNTAFAFEKSKIMFGTDLQGDYTEVKLLDQSEVNGDDVVNCIMKFSGDTNYVLSSDVVYYGPTS